MGHVIEHIALELQTLAGMDCGFGRTRTTGTEGIYYVVFSYMEDDAGVYAAKAAVKIAQALVDAVPYDLAYDIQQLREIKKIRGSGLQPAVLWKKHRNVVFLIYD